MEKEFKSVLSKRDISILGFRTIFLHSAFNFERMQSIGYVVTQANYLKKVYKDDKEGLKKALKNDLEFINTQPVMSAYIVGLMASLRERGADADTVKNIKVALFGPLAGIGDAIFWFTLLPITIGISASLAEQGLIIGPIIFFLVFLTVFLLRIPLAHIGYDTGVGAITKIKENMAKVNKSASILGITVLGGLIASYVYLEVLTTINIGLTDESVSLQVDFFDKIFPNLLPFGFTFLMFWLLKKRFSPVILIAMIIVLSIISSYLGVL